MHRLLSSLMRELTDPTRVLAHHNLLHLRNCCELDHLDVNLREWLEHLHQLRYQTSRLIDLSQEHNPLLDQHSLHVWWGKADLLVSLPDCLGELDSGQLELDYADDDLLDHLLGDDTGARAEARRDRDLAEDARMRESAESRDESWLTGHFGDDLVDVLDTSSEHLCLCHVDDDATDLPEDGLGNDLEDNADLPDLLYGDVDLVNENGLLADEQHSLVR